MIDIYNDPLDDIFKDKLGGGAIIKSLCDGSHSITRKGYTASISRW